MLRNLLTLFLLTSTTVYALPERVEFIFITAGQKKTLLDDFFFKTKTFSMIAQNNNDDEHCVPMGDGCFDPQKGYVMGKKGQGFVDQDYGTPPQNVDVENTIDSNMIRCTGAYFDIFCGKSKKEPKKEVAKYEVWIDTSASMRHADWSKSGDTCFRRSFVSRLSNSCSLKIKAFNSSIKDIANDAYLCQTEGGNNTKKIIRWVKNSNAKHLFVVTDIDEANTELTDFLSSIGATTHGVGTKAMYPEDILTLADNLKASCQK